MKISVLFKWTKDEKSVEMVAKTITKAAKNLSKIKFK